MPNVKAGPNEYLLTGRNGQLVNRGAAVQAFLIPGTVYVSCSEHQAGSRVRLHTGDEGRHPAALQGDRHLPHHRAHRRGRPFRLQRPIRD